MNKRKENVINKAHELFIHKGYQATSIQDILDHSGISKGTFYNYFSSKNELFIDLLKNLFDKIEKERNELLIGQDPADINIFIKQVELQLMTNHKNKLFSLYEEIIVTNDKELKQFVEENYLKTVYWYYERFIDLFGKNKEPYLFDCAIMFLGILQQNVRFFPRAFKDIANIHEVVRYSVARLVTIVEDVSFNHDQLIDPKFLKSWLQKSSTFDKNDKLIHIITDMKKTIQNNEEKDKYFELLHFIQEELIHTRKPRLYLIENVLSSLKEAFPGSEKLQQLEQVIIERNKV